VASAYLDQKFNVKKKVGDIRQVTIQTFLNLKKEFIKTVIQATLLSTGLLALILGIILLLNNFMPLEYILLGYGLIVTLAIIINLKFKA